MKRRWIRFVHRPGVKTFGLVPGAIALALMLKYFCLVLYAGTAIVVLVPSFVAVGGSTFALLWAILIFIFALFALVSTMHTWYTCHIRMELWGIGLLVLTFIAYSIVILVRGALMYNWSGVSVAWLPIALSILPTIRYYSLMARQDDE